jgi:hypothetical protein
MVSIHVIQNAKFKMQMGVHIGTAFLLHFAFCILHY